MQCWVRGWALRFRGVPSRSYRLVWCSEWAGWRGGARHRKGRVSFVVCLLAEQSGAAARAGAAAGGVGVGGREVDIPLVGRWGLGASRRQGPWVRLGAIRVGWVGAAL